MTDLSRYSGKDYYPGNFIKRGLWYSVNCLFFDTKLPFPSFLKVELLRFFGAKIGKKVVIKPCVNIKYPWLLKIGDYSWIGENVWIDNLAKVTIGNNVCISQGALLLTGNHNYKKETFDLMLGEIKIEDSVWICAKAVVCPAVTCKENSVLGVGSVATRDLKKGSVYRGNPAKAKRER